MSETKKNPAVSIYDSTLRDGAQARGITYSVDDKLLIAHRLDTLGVHFIEGGWPNRTNPSDLEFFRRAGKDTWTSAHIVAFGSTRRAGAPAEDDANLNNLLEAETEIVTIFGKTWDLHVRDVLKTDLDENLRIIESSVAFLRSQGRRVIYDAEHYFDGYKQNADYALRSLQAAQDGGAEMLVLCDTNGGTLVSEVQSIIEDSVQKMDVPFGMHAHNDGGVGVANSLVAVELGATQVQGVMNGFGERCGNANLCTIIPALELKMDRQTIGRDKLQNLTDVSKYVTEIANIMHDHRQPYVGESAFAHKGGAHIDAMLKNPQCYEHILPELVGNERQFLMSQQAGTATVAQKLDEIIHDIDKRDPRVIGLLERVKRMEFEGFSFEAADASFELLAMRELDLWEVPFEVLAWRTINRHDGNGAVDADCEAIVKLRVGDEVRHTVSDGNGPVDALNRALGAALAKDFPALNNVRLSEYKVRDLSSGDGTAASVRVLIESVDRATGDSWGTVGVSKNVLEASWRALLDSLCYAILRSQRMAEAAAK
jgi:2-isopropylmalate synthase